MKPTSNQPQTNLKPIDQRLTNVPQRPGGTTAGIAWLLHTITHYFGYEPPAWVKADIGSFKKDTEKWIKDNFFSLGKEAREYIKERADAFESIDTETIKGLMPSNNQEKEENLFDANSFEWKTGPGIPHYKNTEEFLKAVDHAEKLVKDLGGIGGTLPLIELLNKNEDFITDELIAKLITNENADVATASRRAFAGLDLDRTPRYDQKIKNLVEQRKQHHAVGAFNMPKKTVKEQPWGEDKLLADTYTSDEPRTTAQTKGEAYYSHMALIGWDTGRYGEFPHYRDAEEFSKAIDHIVYSITSGEKRNLDPRETASVRSNVRPEALKRLLNNNREFITPELRNKLINNENPRVKNMSERAFNSLNYTLPS